MSKNASAEALKQMKASNAAQDAGRQAEADRLWNQANATLDASGRNAVPRR
jgi:hypothetical protein